METIFFKCMCTSPEGCGQTSPRVSLDARAFLPEHAPRLPRKLLRPPPGPRAPRWSCTCRRDLQGPFPLVTDTRSAPHVPDTSSGSLCVLVCSHVPMCTHVRVCVCACWGGGCHTSPAASAMSPSSGPRRCLPTRAVLGFHGAKLPRLLGTTQSRQGLHLGCKVGTPSSHHPLVESPAFPGRRDIRPHSPVSWGHWPPERPPPEPCQPAAGLVPTRLHPQEILSNPQAPRVPLTQSP